MINNFPTISIITPAYNVDRFISETIATILNQSYSNWELLVIDDGSTDNTAEIVKEYCKKDSRVRYLHQQNGRQGKARNLGIKHSRGSYIAFLDADDLWEREKLETQLKTIERENVDLVFSDIWFFNNGKNYQEQLHITPGLYQGDTAIKAFLKQNRIPILTVLLKKEILKTVNGFTEKPLIQNAEDYHLWLRLLLAGYKFYGEKMPLAHYRMHSNSATGADKIPTLQVLHALKDLLSGYPEYKTQIEVSILNNIYDLLYHRSLPDWNKLEEWIEFFYYFTNQTPRIGFWKKIYTKAGKKFFRSTFLRFYAKSFSNYSLL